MTVISKISRLPILLLSVFCSAAYAIPIKFTASNFQSVFGTPAPQSTVVAYFDYTKNGINITSLNSFNMTITGVNYTLDNIAYNLIGPFIQFADPETGFYSQQFGTNDFYMSFNSGNFSNGYFVYFSTASPNDLWITEDVTAEVLDVPEPTSLGLLALVLSGIRLSRRKSL